MLIQVKDLQIGDEVLYSANSKFKYVKLLRTPTLRTIGHNTGIVHKAVKVSIKNDRYIGRGNRNYSRYKCESDVTQHNDTMYLDMNYNQMWLVKRNRQLWIQK